jgi:hypothetical protein
MVEENFYGGTSYPLEPTYGNPIAYGTPFSEFSQALDPRTANQIKEVSESLNTGAQAFEVQGTTPDVLESIPKDHFKEMYRQAKLVGAELSLHGPMIEPSGITQQGWDKLNQDAAEKQLWSAIERSHDLNPKGNIPVTIHSSVVGLPPAEFKMKETPDGEEQIKSVIVVDPTGRLDQIKEQERYLETGGVPKPFDPVKEIRRRNEETWGHQLGNLNFYAQRGDEAIRIAKAEQDNLNNTIERYKEGKADFEKQGLSPENLQFDERQKAVTKQLEHGNIYLKDAYLSMREIFDLAYKNTNGKDKEKLTEYAKFVSGKVDFEKISSDPKRSDEFAEIVEKGISTLQGLSQPKIFTPVREFAIDKTSDTVSNLALQSYNKFKDSAPIISLENHPAQTTLLSTGKDLKDTIRASRKKFIEKAVKSGISNSEAKQQAAKLIGATWDVGHINMLRRYGYTKKDIIKEAETVAPYVKHLHLSDNFGYDHTELPMGMGNVPMKEVMEKLNKSGFKGKKVVEAGNWWQHFSPGGKSNPPMLPTMQAFGVSMYSMQPSPGWNQYLDTMGGYFLEQGPINPDIHHQLYGSGFSALPNELGGPIQGGGNRMTGTPMA